VANPEKQESNLSFGKREQKTLKGMDNASVKAGDKIDYKNTWRWRMGESIILKMSQSEDFRSVCG